MVRSWLHTNRTRTLTKQKNKKIKRKEGDLALVQTQSYILHQKYTSRKQKRQEGWLHVCTRIQRRNTASNRGDKTTCFKVVSLPAETALNTFWRGGKWPTELWMVSLFKSQRLFKKQKKNKIKSPKTKLPNTSQCEWCSETVPAWLKQQVVSDAVVHKVLYIYTATNRTEQPPYLK